jgi:imidazolonepropionase-like amidohydrolase
MKSFFLLALTALILTTVARGDAPDIYVIRGSRIVPVSGAQIENGTIVLRRGKIEAVGAHVGVPGDALVIDGRGLTVYPGLIDLGSTTATEPLPPASPAEARTTSQLERWKRQQLLRPFARAADHVKVDDSGMARLAAAGITTVLAVPPGDVISGQSALVNVAAPPDAPAVGAIAASRRNLVILKSSVALHVSFPPQPRVGTNAYPVSLMGVISFVRQAFLDAQHYRLERLHQSGADDPALAALQPALERQLPVAFEANRAREILRALSLAGELNLDPIVLGARESDQVIGDLKARQARVIFSLNFPVRSVSIAPDDDEPLRVMEARTSAVRTPMVLASSGIPFAFASAGLADPKEFVRSAARSVKEGLPAAAALRALTLDAAMIAGVADRLGSIDKGKMANLVVTDGDLFDEKTRVVRVFVDGRPMTLDASPSREPRRTEER